jgi:hypothetical protein
MPTSDRSDPLGVEPDRRKLEDDVTDEGPPVSRMATTYGSSFVTSEEQARQLAAEETDEGLGSDDGLGRPRPIGGEGER